MSALRNAISTARPETDAPGRMTPVVVLASQSLNRLRLIQQIGLEPIVRVSDFDENLDQSNGPVRFVEDVALGKLETVKKQMEEKEEPFDAIIACDTIIHFDGNIIGKPKDSQDAIDTLKALRGNTHEVYTGVAMAFANSATKVFHGKTTVQFGKLPDRIIEHYVATGEPLNKAGSYGIQDKGAIFVEGIQGCFSNVVGLPIHRVYSELVNEGVL